MNNLILLKTLVIIFSLLLSSCQKPSATDSEKVGKNVTQFSTETHQDIQTTNQSINIISPTQGSHVCQRTTISGNISNPELQVFILIHPMATNKFWVQPIPNMRSDGRWEAYCYFGEPDQGVGEPFEIIAIASRNRNLFEEGRTLPSPLPNNPDIIFRSNPVVVTRDPCLH